MNFLIFFVGKKTISNDLKWPVNNNMLQNMIYSIFTLFASLNCERNMGLYYFLQSFNFLLTLFVVGFEFVKSKERFMSILEVELMEQK